MASELIFPENTLILMCAAPGCGKSTFASRNFLSTQIVSSDQCRAMVCDDMEDMSVHKETFSLVRHIARMRMRLGKLTVIDSTALSRRMRCSFRKLATAYQFRSGLILLDIPLERCLEQNQKRNRRVASHVIRRYHALLQQTKQTVQKEGFDYVYILNGEQLETCRISIIRDHKKSFQE
ncbi:AAA family ATPase [Melghirimyces algeriensis]|uniref:Predicted kinase n=1 Tax=Melghirimyces algeriensis TaxID=910412 RepID=A0A521BR27_9BACL|nr:AAA family ATPase [Melghirimyces algeriensis]SMO49201.1 Predicted kinase [Melghirimyces algeriensis]